MTLDDLEEIYNKAASDVAFLQYEGPDHRAGIRAVVEALRDEICHGYAENSARDLANTFNAILGDAGEKVAEYTGGMNDLSVTPATDPAPAGCEWIPWQGHWFAHGEALSSRAGQTHCPSCGKPIAFKEAK